MTTERATCWSVTINNPVSEDYDAIEFAKARGWKVEGQVEKGANGTLHLQLMVRTPQVRFSAMKKAFPRAHIEVAKSQAALAKYVSKSETRVAQLPADNKYYPSQAAFFRLVFDFFQKHNYLNLDADMWYPRSFHRWWRDAHCHDPSEDYLWELDRDARDARMLATDLANWEYAVSHLIREGYHIEHHWVNPQVKSAISKFGWSILTRTWQETVRQTEHARLIQSVDIPTIEHNHAEASPSSSRSSSPSPPLCAICGSSSHSSCARDGS